MIGKRMTVEDAKFALGVTKVTSRVRALMNFARRHPDENVRVIISSDYWWAFREPRSKEGLVNAERIGCNLRPPYKYYIWAAAYKMEE